MKGTMAAVIILAASVAAASGSDRSAGNGRPGRLSARAKLNAVAAPASATREFRFRDLVFTVPAAWSVRQADRQPFRPEYVRVTGGPSGPRLTFSDSVQFVRDGSVTVGGAGARTGNGLSMERYEMPNPLTRGIVYVFPAAGVSISAQVRTDAEARAADAVAQGAHRALPVPAPARS
jgi:hypothetical protein